MLFASTIFCFQAKLRRVGEHAATSYRRQAARVPACIVLGALIALSNGADASTLPQPLLAADFDALDQHGLPQGMHIRTQFASPDSVPGVLGEAWRTDGFSSVAECALNLDATAAFTVSIWVALESYPSDLEVPVWKLSPSSILQQATRDAGYDLYVDTFGRWGFRVTTSAGLLRVPAPRVFPLYQWTHIAASIDPASGKVVLYQDGRAVGSVNGAANMSIRHANVPLRLAAPPSEIKILDFTVNRLNAAIDNVAVYPKALTAEEAGALYAVAPTIPDAEPSLRVPDSRFAGDPLRPTVHPMPPANWTNEPHGLVRRGGLWHLFYQRTPNGPYKTQMHWGHMKSADLVHWRHSRDALWPELQTDEFGFDMKGIWSGDVIVEGDKAFAFYTSVNHADRLAASNPGIAMAVSDDPQLRDWRKLGPILNTKYVADFRDPYLWREGNEWHMLIGAALSTGGGLDYYVLRSGEAGGRWERQNRFSEMGYRFMDPGSEIWEMPVFEPLSAGVHILVANPIGGKVSKYGEPATRALYWTGTWNGKVFKPFSRQANLLDLLPGHLAPTVERADDGHLRAIGIVDERRSPGAQQRAGWANGFSFPRTWYLLKDGRTLGQAPAPELVALRGNAAVMRAPRLIGSPSSLVQGLRAWELLLEFDEAGAPRPFDIDVLASADGREFTRLSFDPQGGVSVDKSHSTLSTEGEGPQLLKGDYSAAAYGVMRTVRVFVDGSVIEVFINDAAAYAVRSYPTLADSTGVRLSSGGTQPISAFAEVWPLRKQLN